MHSGCYIVESCPLTKLDGGLIRLHSAVESAVKWLTSHRTWSIRQQQQQMQQHGLFVGLSVCLDRETGKTAELIKMPFGLWTWVGPRNHVLDQVLYGVQIPHAKGQFWGEKGRPIVKYRDTLPRAVQKQLNRSRCHLGLGLRWAQGSTY